MTIQLTQSRIVKGRRYAAGTEMEVPDKFGALMVNAHYARLVELRGAPVTAAELAVTSNTLAAEAERMQRGRREKRATAGAEA